jgi:hypothetical protein
MAKERMKQEINEHRAKDILVSRIFSVLHSGPEYQVQWILYQIRRGKNIEDLACALEGWLNEGDVKIENSTGHVIMEGGYRTEGGLQANLKRDNETYLKIDSILNF